ncbi:MAG: hypothetical protein ASARMPREDX12_002271 [Alectoria sarmentosa]|nr:MAG: hypothetical protein ASARMPREDX12_002271 [Alectoria sarmentosa]
MGDLKLPFGCDLCFFAQSDGTKIKTLELSRAYFDEYEQGVEEFSRAVTGLNDENGIVLDECTTNFLYLIQVHKKYPIFDSMAMKLREESTSAGLSASQAFLGEPQFSRRVQMTQQQCYAYEFPLERVQSHEAVNFQGLSKNIVLANPGGVDDDTMDEVLDGINKNVWYDRLHFVKKRRNNERMEIKAVANVAKSVSIPPALKPVLKAQDKAHRQATPSISVPSDAHSSHESHQKDYQEYTTTKRSRPYRRPSPLDFLSVPPSGASVHLTPTANTGVSAARHRNLDRVMHGRVKSGKAKEPKPRPDNGSTPPYISRKSSASEVSVEARRANLSPSALWRAWAGREEAGRRVPKNVNDTGKHLSKRKGEHNGTRRWE